MLCLAFTIPTLIYQTGVFEEQLIWQEKTRVTGLGFFFSLLFSLRGQTCKQLVEGIALEEHCPPHINSGREDAQEKIAMLAQKGSSQIPDFV